MSETDSGKLSLAEVLRKSLEDFLKNREGIGGGEILRRSILEKMPLQDAFKSAVNDRKKLRGEK